MPATDRQTFSSHHRFDAGARRFRGSLARKLTLFVIALLLTTAVAMTASAYLIARHIVRDQIHERLAVASADRHAMVLSFVAQQHERVGLVASRTQLRELVGQHLAGEVDEEQMRERTRRILLDAQGSTKGFLDIWIAGNDGRVITATDDRYFPIDYADHMEFERGKTSPHLGIPHWKDPRWVALLTAPATDDAGRRLGVVMVLLDVSRLVDILSETRGLGDTGEVLDATRDGERARYLLPTRDSRETTVPLAGVPAMQAAIAGEKNDRIVETDYNGTVVLAHDRPIAYQPRHDRPWGLVAKIDASEAYEPVGRLSLFLSGVEAVLLLPALAACYWLARRFVRPIVRLDHSGRNNGQHEGLEESRGHPLGFLSVRIDDVCSSSHYQFWIPFRKAGRPRLSAARRTLPNDWTGNVRSAVLRFIGLAQYVIAYTRS